MTRTIEEQVDLLLSDPAALVGHSLQNWKQMPAEQINALQLAGLKRRFGEMRDRIAVLKKLADAEGIERIEQLDDVVPLLFEHTLFKSYPPSLLEKNNFAAINKWLGKLVVPELAEKIAAVDVTACKGLDDWFETMDSAIPELCLSHTSGTSGTLSFLPCSAREFEKASQVRKLYAWNMTGADTPDPDLHTAYPYYRKGYLSHLRGMGSLVRVLLPDLSHFHPAYPSTLSSDVLRLGAGLRAAHANGTLDRACLLASPLLAAWLAK